MSAQEMLARASGEGAAMPATTTRHAAPPLATIIAELVALGARRRFAIKQQIRMDNALGAYIRRGMGWRLDAPEKEREAIRKRAAALVRAIEAGKATDDPLADTMRDIVVTSRQGREAFDALREGAEKNMRKLAKTLPVHAWARGVKGFGDLGLAIVVAECGDEVGNYKSPSAVWKRCGLAVINGERQRKHSDADLAAEHGYNPRRRAEIWTLADSMFKHQWAGADKETGEAAHAVGPYGEDYGRKKAEYMQRVEATAELPAGPEKWTPKRADNAARRYMTKCLLRDLWRAWRAASDTPAPTLRAPPAED